MFNFRFILQIHCFYGGWTFWPHCYTLSIIYTNLKSRYLDFFAQLEQIHQIIRIWIAFGKLYTLVYTFGSLFSPEHYKFVFGLCRLSYLFYHCFLQNAGVQLLKCMYVWWDIFKKWFNAFFKILSLSPLNKHVMNLFSD